MKEGKPTTGNNDSSTAGGEEGEAGKAEHSERAEDRRLLVSSEAPTYQFHEVLFCVCGMGQLLHLDLLPELSTEGWGGSRERIFLASFNSLFRGK